MATGAIMQSGMLHTKNGHAYRYAYGRLCDCYYGNDSKACRWFLWCEDEDGEFVGDYKPKAAMLEAAEQDKE